jgi:hypothetical protein
MNRSFLRTIPSVEKVLQAVGDDGFPRPVVLAVVRRELEAIRKKKMTVSFDGVLSRVRAMLRVLHSSRIHP